MISGYQILEVANVHGGDLDHLHELIERVEHLGSPGFGIKFQVLDPDLISLPDFSYYELYKQLHFTLEEWEGIINKASKTKEVWIDIFDLYGVQVVSNNLAEVSGIKFQASVLDNLEVFNALSSVDLSEISLMLNIAGLNLDQIRDRIETVIALLNSKELILQVGFQSYPTKIQDSGIAKIGEIKSHFNLPIVFADHTDGENDDAFLIPLLALHAGAVGIEKHIMIDRERTEYDFQASLSLDCLQKFQEYLEQYYFTFSQDFINQSEAEYLAKSIQKPILRHAIVKGAKVIKSDLYYRRTDRPGMNADELEKFIKAESTLAHDLPKNSPFTESDFE
ncbi:MAG: N-acetylneuraminate synthase family protein [Flavobacteriales bacterium]|nr:N-acetylneuraminate synthase family protein [Flavobacteriales bacterium]